ERYVPYQPTTQPQEILTQANAILGQGQMSLAKYLWIIDQASAPDLNVNQIDEFLCRTLERVDWRRDLHFQTRTTIDTLDYSGSGFNQGSKVVVAAAGPAIRQLANELPADLQLPPGLGNPQLCLPGILAINGPKFQSGQDPLPSLLQPLDIEHPINRFPLVLVVDDSEFCARTLNNFLWTVFTRSNPASDIHGIGAQIIDKHWGCQGSLVIDARIKPQHAPPLVEDPEITKRVDQLAGQNQELGPYL
ncbi:MAG: 3-octaprenyl-4-hydroxybenzoate carboxy-lyase, partial [Planctomycetaceae bacterium]|nr:3-octaprenyl-4-hydroxybenzoate carboxy-lyase [Planctomycetaceae bacterium]